MKVSVIGQGYVGLPVAIAAAEVGFDVTGIDTNSTLVSKISSGISQIGDVLDSQISELLARGKYSCTTDFTAVANCEIIVICVPTPLDELRKPDFSYLLNAVSSISEHLSDNALVILESTVSPGTTRDLVAPLLDGTKISYELAYSPERIDPSNKLWGIKNTPKLVAGVTETAGKRASNFYRNFVETVLVFNSVEVVETAKLLENSFRLINISFINEIAQFCQTLGLDIGQVIEAAATKPYGFMPFYPSAGVGGHCIPVDPIYLSSKAHELGLQIKSIELADAINVNIPIYFGELAAKMLGGLTKKRILLVGVAYKPNVSDVRETPASALMHHLRERGAFVTWHDDLVKQWQGEFSTELSDDFDLAILVNPHTSTELSQLHEVPILDTRGRLK